MGEEDREDVNIRNVAAGESSGVVTSKALNPKVALWVIRHSTEQFGAREPSSSGALQGPNSDLFRHTHLLQTTCTETSNRFFKLLSVEKRVKCVREGALLVCSSLRLSTPFH